MNSNISDARREFLVDCDAHRKASGGRLTEADARRYARERGIPDDQVPEVWDPETPDVLSSSESTSDGWARKGMSRRAQRGR